MLPTVSTIHDLRGELLSMREAGYTIAFVPTMGALHKGHMALVDAARKCAKRVVVSIFVNPLQFAPAEDLTTYPRRLDDDKQLLADHGCDLLYAPQTHDMYGPGFVTQIDPGPMAKILEGTFRPHFFCGVATVVTKLLLQIMPDIVFFGEKDYQQLLVIRRVVRDLDLPIHVAGIPIVRDVDGLALSSRNVYLSPDERQRAIALPQTLTDTIAKLHSGSGVEDALKAGRKQLQAAGFNVDYLELAHAATLEPLRRLQGPARLLVAVKIGATRLIDNMSVDKA